MSKAVEVCNGLTVLRPEWPVHASVKAVVSTRQAREGQSLPPWNSFNLGQHVGDDPRHVDANRHMLASSLDLPAGPVWLSQVHGTKAVDAAFAEPGVEADASYTSQPGIVCAIMTADCLPVFLAARDGSEVAVAHAGWRGLCDGVIESTIKAMSTSPASLLAWLGPAIGPMHFEVGDEVRQQFLARDPAAAECFTHSGSTAGGDHWLANLYQLARQRLASAGVSDVSGGEHCTFSEESLFYSYRRDGQTGRMASLVWIS